MILNDDDDDDDDDIAACLLLFAFSSFPYLGRIRGEKTIIKEDSFPSSSSSSSSSSTKERREEMIMKESKNKTSLLQFNNYKNKLKKIKLNGRIQLVREL